jgi:pimeloyl-ACP methyl ester carboxylesterase
VTFAHRGFSPSSALPGGPDPADYADDLAALIDRLDADDVRIVAQSMGGWCAVEYALRAPARVRALVLASTAGAIARAPSLFGDPAQMPGWEQTAAAAAAAMQANNIHVAAGERMAREQPAAHFLYQEIDALSGIDKLKLRQRLATGPTRPADALRTLDVPTLWLTGAEDVVYPPFLSAILARMMPKAEVAQVEKAGHSVYFERPAEFNGSSTRFSRATRRPGIVSARTYFFWPASSPSIRASVSGTSRSENPARNDQRTSRHQSLDGKSTERSSPDNIVTTFSIP